MKVFAVRHGHREDDPLNPKGKKLPNGRTLDPDISIIGEKQAIQTGLRLKDEGIQRVYCSPFLRAIHTAHNIVSQFEKKPPIWLDWGFAEHLNPMYFSDWPGTIHPDKIKRMYPLIESNPEITGVFPDCPEDYWPMHDRVIKAVNLIIERHKGENILIVAHAATVCSIAPGLVGWPGYEPRGYLCGITKITDESGQWKLEMNGDTSHLEFVGL